MKNNITKYLWIFIIITIFIVGCSNDKEEAVPIHSSETDTANTQEAITKSVYLEYYSSNFGVDCMDKYTTMYLIDLTNDGKDEMIVVEQGYITYGEGRKLGRGNVLIYTQDDSGNVTQLWNYEIYFEAFIYLTRIEGKYYLLQYFPRESHGMCSFYYKIFSLTNEGEEVIYKQVDADIWFPNKMSMDDYIIEVEAFWDKVEKDLNTPYVLVEYGNKFSSYYSNLIDR